MNYQNEEWLYDKYWVKELNTTQIAKLCKVHRNTILYQMTKLNITRRNLDKAHLNNNSHWQGGRTVSKEGYVWIWVEPTSSFFSMSYRNYIEEHRLVMAQHLSRCLESCEIVHHINGIRDDNRIENLEIMTRGEHTILHQKAKRGNILDA